MGCMNSHVQASYRKEIKRACIYLNYTIVLDSPQMLQYVDAAARSGDEPLMESLLTGMVQVGAVVLQTWAQVGAVGRLAYSASSCHVMSSCWRGVLTGTGSRLVVPARSR